MTSRTPNARQVAHAKLTPFINLHNAKSWAHSPEKYLFVIDLLDDAEVSNGHWRWLENSLAALWTQHTAAAA
jgi:hypothetical protein